MNVVIEKRLLDDVAEVIFNLVQRTFTREFDPPTKDVAAVKEYLRDSEVYSVSDNGVSIGYFSFNLTSDKTVELKSIALLPSYQGKGIGKQMLDKLFELTQGCIINLVVHPGNTAALISYLKNGFVIKGWKEDYFEDNQPRILMETCFD